MKKLYLGLAILALSSPAFGMTDPNGVPTNGRNVTVPIPLAGAGLPALVVIGGAYAAWRVSRRRNNKD